MLPPAIAPEPAFTVSLLEVFASYLPVLSNLCSKVKLHGYRPGKLFLAATWRKDLLSTKPSQAHVVGPRALKTEYAEWWRTQHKTRKKDIFESRGV